MKKQDLFFGILGLVLIILFFGWIFIYKVWSVLKGANPTILSAIIGVSGTIFLSIISVFIGRYLEKQKIIEGEIRNKKIPVYEEFIQKTLSYVLDKDENKDINTLMPYFTEFSQKLIVWGNQKVIRKWVEFRVESQRQNRELMVIFEELLFEIRKDIGQNNSELKFGDLMSVFINDYHEYMTNKIQKSN